MINFRNHEKPYSTLFLLLYLFAGKTNSAINLTCTLFKKLRAELVVVDRGQHNGVHWIPFLWWPL